MKYSAWLVLLALVVNTNAHGAGLSTGPSTPTSAPAVSTVVEYYHSGLDHYFITANPAEIDALDNGVLTGWTRTGNQFSAYSSSPTQAGFTPVARFYGRPEAGLNSHFYSGSAQERSDLQTKFASAWTLESNNVFQVKMPDTTTGACPAGTVPVYRLYNNRADVNHRYTTDLSTRQAMIDKGHVSEGYGTHGVGFCADSGTVTTSSPLSATITSSSSASDTFTFTATANGLATNATATYLWNFGDGMSSAGPTAVHRYGAAGTYTVTVSVTASNGAVGTATKTVVASVPASNAPAVTINATQTAADTYDFTATVVRTANGATVSTYRWDFGDGTNASGATVSHRYNLDGNYTVVLTATDSKNEVGSASTSVTVAANQSSPPTHTPASGTGTASASILVSQMSPDTFDFSSIATASAGASIVSYAWNFGDGTGDTGATTTHQFQLDGTYPVVLTVADSKSSKASATRSVVVSKQTSRPSGSADFDARKNAPGVIRYFDFDSAYPVYPANLNYAVQPGTSTMPTVDTAVKASGAGSLRFDIPGKSASNAAGNFFANFSPDYSVRFGENSEFYVQWRQRFNRAMVETFFTNNTDGGPQGGIKMMGLETGDVVDPAQPYGLRTYSACQAIGVLVQTWYQQKFPISYNSCTGSASHGPYALFQETTPSDFKLQNAMPSCIYSNRGKDCFYWAPDEWMTFEVHVKLGARVGDEWIGEYQLWGAREGQAAVKLIDWNPSTPGYFRLTAGAPGDDQKFGKIWLLPYMTGKDPNQDHPLAQTWYDELIISRQWIAFPSSSASTPTSVPTPTPTGSPPSSGNVPAWRIGLPVGQPFELQGTAKLGGYRWKAPDPTGTTGATRAWQGMARIGTNWYLVAASGHGEWQNPALMFDLTTLKWSVLNPGSDPNYTTYKGITYAQDPCGAYYSDGRPSSRHTYYTPHAVRSENSRDGVARIMLLWNYAAYGTAICFGGGPQTDGFRLSDNEYDQAGTWPNAPLYPSVQIPAEASDPRNDAVYLSAGMQLFKFDPKSGSYSAIKTTPSYPSPGFLVPWDAMPSVVDAKRNRLVALTGGRPYYGPTLRLQTVDLATNVITDIPITGSVPILDEGTSIVHDLDCDCYDFLEARSGKVFRINPDTGASAEWTTVPVPVNGPYSRFEYFPELGGIAYLPGQWEANAVFLPTR